MSYILIADDNKDIKISKRTKKIIILSFIGALFSIFVFFHSTHDLHQLKKACSQQRSNAVRSMYYTM